MKQKLCFKKALSLLLLMAALCSYAQNSEIKGRVSESNLKNALNGVTVKVKGSSVVTVSDEQGQYRINAGADAVLVFSMVGYTAKEEVVSGRSVINVSLSESTQNLNDVIVVGYSVQRKALVTGSVEAVSGEELTNRGVPTVTAGLQGLLPGATVVQKSGQPGLPNTTIRVRGTTTWGNNDPLVLIDGTPGDIDQLNPNDIESISVLKDAASSAIYGARASNGVILITSRSGAKNKPLTVTYSGLAGMDQVTRKPKFVTNPYTFMNLTNEAYTNIGAPAYYSQAQLTAVQNGTADTNFYSHTNWISQVYKSAAYQQSHNINVSGGNNTTSYFMSYGNTQQDGIIVGDNTKSHRNNLRMRITSDLIKNRLTFDGNLTYSNSKTTQPAISAGSVILQAHEMTPLVPVRFSDGNWGTSTVSSGVQNPLAEAYNGGLSTTTASEVVATGTATLQLIRGMTFKGTYSTFISNANGDAFDEKLNYTNPGTTNVLATNRTFNSLYQDNTRNQSQNYTLQLDYYKKIGLHSFSALAGYSEDWGLWKWFAAYRDNYVSDATQVMNAGSTTDQSISGDANDYALHSYYGRINYNYAEKYLFEANIRRDGSSRFSAANRWGTFPSASVGWRISQEKFFAKLKPAVNEMKVRLSYGSLGNQNVGGTLYPYTTAINPLTNIFPIGNIQTSGYAQTTLPNPNIKWETVTESNLGIDAGFLNNRLTLSGDIFIKKTKDMLLSPQLPAVLGGLTSANINLGKMDNKGWELSLGWKDQTGNLRYSFTASLANTKNKITSLGGTPAVLNDATRQIGHSVDALYGYKVKGIAQVSDFTTNSSGKLVPKFPIFSADSLTVAPGDLIYEDINGTVDSYGKTDGKPDGHLTAADRVIFGDLIPHYTYSFRIDLQWKAWDFSAFIYGVGQATGYMYGSAVQAFTSIYSMPQEYHLNRWTPTNNNASYPRFTAGQIWNQRFSSYWLQNGAYLRLKNAQIGYTVPFKKGNQAGIDKCRFFLSGDNLFLITKYFYAYDPETTLTDGTYYPKTRTIFFGVNVTFK
jgi:TonB-linked SusC/RagA family outer membrane protein